MLINLKVFKQKKGQMNAKQMRKMSLRMFYSMILYKFSLLALELKFFNSQFSPSFISLRLFKQ